MLNLVLGEEVFAFLLVFTRLGTALILIPALGEMSVPARIRLVLALLLSFLTLSLVREGLPPQPATIFGLTGLLISEVVIGAMIGTSARMIMGALHVAGTVIGFQGGLAAAQQFDPTQGTSGALIASFLGLIGILIIFTTNLHHMLIGALRYSYDYFPVGATLPFAQFAELITDTIAGAFTLCVQLAAPFLVYGLIFHVGLGLIARLMPQLPVFFVAMPLNVFMGFVILSVSIGAMMLWFEDYFTDRMMYFLP